MVFTESNITTALNLEHVKPFCKTKRDIIVFVLSGGQEYNEEFNFGPSHFAL